MEKYYLGIDNGGTMSKAALFTSFGKEVAVAARPVDHYITKNNRNERDADLMWKKTVETIREVIHISGVSPEQIKAVACTGHGNGLYLIDEKGSPVRKAINSTDGRAQQYIDKWIAQGVDKKALPMTAQSLWAAQPNALMAWLRDNEPETLENARWILMAKDFIRFKLTGEIKAEITDMSGTSLMNVVTGKYDSEVLEMFGLAEFEYMLPPLIGTTDPGGKVIPEAARLTGLKVGTPVAGGMFDIDACGLASGIVDEGQMSMVVGTWGNNQYISRKPLIDEDLFMTSIYSIPGWYLMLEGSPTSAGNLDWFIKNFLQAEREQMGTDFFNWVNHEVERIAPEKSKVLYLPFLFGCNAKKDLAAGFYNIQGEYSRAHLLRAVYEGIVFSHKSHIDRLLNFRGKPDVIRCTGAATQSEVWMQMFADGIEIAIEIPAGTQLGALGAAIAAAVCAGDYANLNEAVENMTSVTSRFEPNKKRADIYKSKYSKYNELINRLS